MKKILTLLVVLAVANLATAAISWEVTDNGDGTFGVSLVADENVQSVQIGKLSSSGSTFVISPVESGSVWVGNFAGTKQGFYDLSGFGDTGYGAATGNQGTTAGSWATGTMLSFTVTGTAGDVITVADLPAFSMVSEIYTQADGTNAMSFADFGAGSFTLVPEPMTMALLGLGGLFIRRRRA